MLYSNNAQENQRKRLMSLGRETRSLLSKRSLPTSESNLNAYAYVHVLDITYDTNT